MKTKIFFNDRFSTWQLIQPPRKSTSSSPSSGSPLTKGLPSRKSLNTPTSPTLRPSPPKSQNLILAAWTPRWPGTYLRLKSSLSSSHSRIPTPFISPKISLLVLKATSNSKIKTPISIISNTSTHQIRHNTTLSLQNQIQTHQT